MVVILALAALAANFVDTCTYWCYLWCYVHAVGLSPRDEPCWPTMASPPTRAFGCLLLLPDIATCVTSLAVQTLFPVGDTPNRKNSLACETIVLQNRMSCELVA